MRRVMSLWLPSWPTDRLRRRGTGSADGEARPFVTALTVGSRRLVAAASPEAAAAGIAPGLPLADAQAFLPGLVVFEADPAGDAAALRRLAEWCGRYSPWTAPDGADGILLDITGCAHLLGGEASLAAAALARLARAGHACRAAIADTPAAAWALARFGAGSPIIIEPAALTPGAAETALAALPVAALRLPAETVAGLERLGIKRIADLANLPRAGLAQRFGKAAARRLDQALGRAGEPVSPLRPRAARRTRLAFAEPIATPEDLARALARLCDELCRGLAEEGVGARRLELACYRVDGGVERAAIGTARPNRDPRHIARLFDEKLPLIDPGLGIEDMVLAAPIAEKLATVQLATLRNLPPPLRHSFFPPPLAGDGRGVRALAASAKPADAAANPRIPHLDPPPQAVEEVVCAKPPQAAEEGPIAALVDRLGARLGLANIHRPEPRESHLPERAVAAAPPLGASAKIPEGWPAGMPRPVRLFDPPQPVEATAPVPDDPPVMFRWRRRLHRVRRADGPERIAGEWWRAGDPGDIRDYYRVEDETGRRFWLYRAGLYREDQPARWFVHGLFG